MTHSSEHVVVRASTPIEVAGVKTNCGIASAALVVIGVLIGALLFWIGGTGLVLLDVLRNRLIRARAFHGGTLFQNRGGVVYQLIGDLQRNRKLV